MRKLITITCITLDGVLQSPGGPEEDADGGFEHGGWAFPYWDETVDSINEDIKGKPFDLLLGRRTYDFFAAFWPEHEDIGDGKAMNAATKYVASRGTPDLTWKSSHHIEGDVVEGVRALKHEDGPDLQVHGSGDLIQTLLGSDLVDEMRVLMFPLTVGKGKRLFGEECPGTKFAVARTATSKSGVISAVYEPVGPIRTGSFALGE